MNVLLSSNLCDVIDDVNMPEQAIEQATALFFEEGKKGWSTLFLLDCLTLRLMVRGSTPSSVR